MRVYHIRFPMCMDRGAEAARDIEGELQESAHQNFLRFVLLLFLLLLLHHLLLLFLSHSLVIQQFKRCQARGRGAGGGGFEFSSLRCCL